MTKGKGVKTTTEMRKKGRSSREGQGEVNGSNYLLIQKGFATESKEKRSENLLSVHTTTGKVKVEKNSRVCRILM